VVAVAVVAVDLQNLTLLTRELH